LKKKSVQNEEYFKIETRRWCVGDLVKVLEYDITEIASYSYGIVTSYEPNEGYEAIDGQLNMFPCFGIQLIDGRQIKSPSYNLEIISAV
tara:strand:- start:2535 stop:2801 length:267 start_codon:yes stop_codon:yes gene_type:complete